MNPNLKWKAIFIVLVIVGCIYGLIGLPVFPTSLAQLKAVGDVVTRSVPHHAYEVLRARQPAWLNEWAAWFLSRNSLAWGPVLILHTRPFSVSVT